MGQGKTFSTRLSQASEKNREIFFSIVNMKYETSFERIRKIQSLNSKTRLISCKIVSTFYDDVSYRGQGNFFMIEEDFFSNIAQSIASIVHEALLLKNFLQREPQVRSMNEIFFDLYYTIIRILSDVGGEN